MKLSKEFIVGLLVVVGGGILYLGFNFLKGKDFFSSSQSYKVQYTDLKGLTVQNPVQLYGNNIGRVDEINARTDGEPGWEVIISINNDDVVITEGTSGMLFSTGLMTGMGVKIELGKSTKALESGSMLLSKVETSMTDQAMEVAGPLIDNSSNIVAKIDSTMTDEFQDNIAGIMKNLEKTTEDFAKLSGDLGVMIKKDNQQVTTLLAQSQTLMKETTNLLKGLEPTIKNMAQISDSLSAIELNKTLSSVEKSMANLESITKKIDNNTGTMGKLINDKALYEQLDSLTSNLNKLVVHFDDDPRYFLKPLGTKKKK